MSAQQEQEYEVKAGLETLEGFDIVGISIITNNKNEQASDDINALWERFFKEQVGQKVDNKINDIIYAVYSDYEGDHNDPYRITIGYRAETVDNVAESMHVAHIEPGDYGILSAQGPQPQTLMETWAAIWSSDLNRKYATDFEVYGPRFFEEGVNEVLIYIGLENNEQN